VWQFWTVNMSTPPSPAKNRNWIWYFIGIALVTTILLTWLALFVHQQMQPGKQLKLEQLQAARRLWDAKGSKDYLLLYTVQRGGDKSKDLFFVTVRGGKVESAILNGKERLPPDQLDYHSMRGLFIDIEQFLRRDAQPDGPRILCRGYFDSEDGHLLEFTRSVSDPPERVIIKVEEFRPMPEKT
jgi:hypothetical protein